MSGAHTTSDTGFQMIDIKKHNPHRINTIPPSMQIEHCTWYLTWTSWDTPIPAGVNMVNIFVGKLCYVDGKATCGGFGNVTDELLDKFVETCSAQNIAVKVSLGGGGGQYDDCWDVLTNETSVSAFAAGLDEFCRKHKLAGVDFDYEEYRSPEQEKAVGKLILEFKTLNPAMQASLCTNAGYGPDFQWQGVVQTIMDAACQSGTGVCALDRLYVMSYYDPMASEITWLTGWRDWVKTRYNMEPWQVSAGIDDFDAHAYDIGAFSAAAKTLGLSTAYWAWNPATPAQSNASAQKVLDSYNGNTGPLVSLDTRLKSVGEQFELEFIDFISTLAKIPHHLFSLFTEGK